MEIRIKSLTLHNFKGVTGDRTFTFGGKNARIEGDNGTGKSTVFDAFTWLLFGKDHQDRDWTNFNIKPIDPKTRETIHNMDGHWVEAVLLIDGVTKTLRRVVTEDWVKPRGETERILKGHTQQFFIDGVDVVTKKNYDMAIHQWIDEDVFRIVTNPLFFIDDRFTPWQNRRKILLSIAGDSFLANAGDFADLVKEMAGEPVEQFRKRVAAAKRAQREEVEKATANIDAWNAALPQEADIEKTNAEIKCLEAELSAKLDEINALIKEVDAGLQDASAANDARTSEIGKKNAQIMALQNDMANYITEGLKAQTEQKTARQRAISEASMKVGAASANLDTLYSRERSLKAKLEEYQLGRAEEAARLTDLGAKYQKERDAAFNPDVETVCPHCGRPYPEEVIEQKGEQLRAEWQASRLKAMKQIQERVPAIREQLAIWNSSIAKTEKELADTKASIESMRTELKYLDDVLAEAKAAPEIDTRDAELRLRKSPEYLAMAEKADDLALEVKELSEKVTTPKELLADRQRYVSEIFRVKGEHENAVRPLNDILAVDKERQRMLRMIEDETARRALLTDELARLERLEVRTLEYIKASVDSCEDAINARFQIARWKMFDTTLDGGIVEMCEVTTLDGVPYRSMNDAMRILCGLDVIRVLSEANDVAAPIFIDNAESVTAKDFGLQAQTIRLVVSAGTPLTVIPE